MAGRTGPGPERGQDENRPPHRRVRLPRLELPPLPRPQAADQAVQGGRQEAPATARGRDAQAARTRTRGRSSPRSTPSSGAGRPTTGAWCPARSSHRSGTTRGQLTYKWARYSHPNKPARWVASRYYGKFCPSRDDKWVFGDRETGAYLLRHSWTSIRRHVMVKGRASPDDPDLAGYWENRRRKNGPPLDAGTLALLARQAQPLPALRGPAHRRQPPPVLARGLGRLVAQRHPPGHPPRSHRGGNHPRRRRATEPSSS